MLCAESSLGDRASGHHGGGGDMQIARLATLTRWTMPGGGVKSLGVGVSALALRPTRDFLDTDAEPGEVGHRLSPRPGRSPRPCRGNVGVVQFAYRSGE